MYYCLIGIPVNCKVTHMPGIETSYAVKSFVAKSFSLGLNITTET